MTAKANPVFVVGEVVTIAGLHRNFRPRIVAIEYAPNRSGKATVKSDGLPGSSARAAPFRRLRASAGS